MRQTDRQTDRQAHSLHCTVHEHGKSSILQSHVSVSVSSVSKSVTGAGQENQNVTENRRIEFSGYRRSRRKQGGFPIPEMDLVSEYGQNPP